MKTVAEALLVGMAAFGPSIIVNIASALLR